MRHHSLFVPRDFDVSPYFAIVKPSLAACFDHRSLVWHVPGSGRAGAGAEPQAASTLPEVAPGAP